MSTAQVVRSWMRQRAGESRGEFLYRVNHSCYRCGWFTRDMTALNAHEDLRECPPRT